MERIDQMMQKKYEKIPKECKIAFLSAIILGLLAHNYMFTNKLPNYDDMGVTGFGATFRLGRWFLWVLGAILYHLDFSYSLPWINGIVSIVLISISASMLTYIFRIKNKITIILISGILIVFPSWTATFFFMFTVPYYAIAIFLGVFGLYLTVKNKNGFWGGVICTVLSLGIYQAFFPFIASIYVIVLIQKLIREEDVNSCIVKSFKYLFLLLFALAFYALITKLTLWITNQQLASYRGLDNVNVFSKDKLRMILEEIFSCFPSLCINNNYEVSYNLLLKIGYIVSFCIWFWQSVIYIYTLFKKNNTKKCIWFVVLSVALFVSINGISIMCPEADAVYILMRYSYVVILFYPVLLVNEYIEIYGCNVKEILCEDICVLVLLGMSISYIHFANAQYLSMELGLKQTIGFYTPIITQIKSLEGYTDELGVVFVGISDDKIEDKTMYRNDVMRIFDISGRDSVLSQTYSLQYFLSVYCGFSPLQFEYYMGDGNAGIEEVVNMPVYPQSGSIKIIDKKVVVKLAN